MAYPPFHPKSAEPPPLTLTEEEFSASFPHETEVIERKTGASGKGVGDAVVAFSNADGGVILIGVDDGGTIVGRELTPGLEDDLHRIMRNVSGAGRYELHPLAVDGKQVTVVSVARRVQGFAQTSDGRVLVRRGTTKPALLGAELTRFLSRRSLERFEDTGTEAVLDAVAPQRLARVAREFGWGDRSAWSERLAEHGLVTESENRLTVAGALTLLDKPSGVLGKAFVEILRFPEEGAEYDRRVEVAGPIDEQVETVTRLVLEELGHEVVVLGVRRHELPRLPRRVVREAVANAIAHRSYEQGGRAVRIELRPDAVQVVSPGGFPESITEQNIREHQEARNLRVLQVLRRFNLAEDLGEGVNVMQDLMRDEMFDPPRFRDTGESVQVTLPIRGAVGPAERAWVKEIERRGLIEPADRILLVHAARGKQLTNSVARDLLGVDPLTARDSLQRLRDAGFLVQRGQRAGTTYVLESSLAPPAGLRLSDGELQELVLDVAREEEAITNSTVRARTGLDRVEALRVLDALVGQGRLRRVGQRRGTRYLLKGD